MIKTIIGISILFFLISAKGWPEEINSFNNIYHRFSILLKQGSKKKSDVVEEFLRYLRRKGRLVGLYEVKKSEIINISPPFFAIFENDEIVYIKSLESQKEMYLLETLDGKDYKLSREEFLKRWNGEIICRPLLNRWLKVGRKSGETKVYIIYSYHDEKPELIKREIDYILEKCKRPIYVDELGLIPEESISSITKYKRLSTHQAFKEAKHKLTQELNMLEKGIPIFDSNSTYREIYRYLAEKRIKGVMENLSYDNWREITYFDKLDYPGKILAAFLAGDVLGALKFLERYSAGFWTYNVKLRDENFCEQIVDLVNDNPGNCIFTIRGIGHLGLEEKLEKEGIETEIIIIGKGELEENLIFQQLLHIYSTLNVPLSYGYLRELLLRSYIQEILRLYYKKEFILSFREATRKAYLDVKKLSFDEIIELFQYAKRLYLLKGKDFRLDSLSQYIYHWIQEKKK